MRVINSPKRCSFCHEPIKDHVYRIDFFHMVDPRGRFRADESMYCCKSCYFRTLTEVGRLKQELQEG